MGCPSSKEISASGGTNNIGVTNGKKSNKKSTIDSISETAQATFGGINVRYAYLSKRGYYPDDENKANQDSYSVTHDFCNNKSNAFFGVYDGHGPDGHELATFAANIIPELVCRHVQQKLEKQESIVNVSMEDTDPAEETESNNENSNTEISSLATKQLHNACTKAHVQCNSMMHKEKMKFDDIMSGTTSISCFVHGNQNRITVCNVGDSRAIIGTKRRPLMSNGGNHTDNNNKLSPLIAIPLSKDQTPYRLDECRRIKKYGGRIMSAGQMTNGGECMVSSLNEEDDELDLGEEIDENGDPPRVWSCHGEYPGTAFTRSLGDEVADKLGVIAEPEILTLELTTNEKVIILASDGVFEFLTNRAVIDICCRYDDPLKACDAIVDEAYCKWLENECRSDDITIICIFIDDVLQVAESNNNNNVSNNDDDLVTTVDKLIDELPASSSHHNNNKKDPAINDSNKSSTDRRKTMIIDPSLLEGIDDE